LILKSKINVQLSNKQTKEKEHCSNSSWNENIFWVVELFLWKEEEEKTKEKIQTRWNEWM